MKKKTQVLHLEGRIGTANTFLLINEKKAVVVDCGTDGKARYVVRVLKERGLEPDCVKYILCTHTHFDHTKGLKNLKELLPKAKLVVHAKEAKCLSTGHAPVPDGTGLVTNTFVWFGRNVFSWWCEQIPPVKPDIIVKGDELDLSAEMGFLCKVLWTPGHSPGSICVQWGKKDIICGDTVMGVRKGNCFPLFCCDVEKLLKSWNKIVKLGVERLHPAHNRYESTKCISIESFKKTYHKKIKEYKLDKLGLLDDPDDAKKSKDSTSNHQNNLEKDKQEE